MIPYHHQWAIVRTEEERIDITCKDHNGEQRYVLAYHDHIIFIGSLDQCQTAVDLNNT